MVDRRSLLKLLSSASLASLYVPSSAMAAIEFPTQPIELFVGFPPGGGVDAFARAIASGLSAAQARQPVVVINKPGAGSTLSLLHVGQAQADGHTLNVSSTGSLVLRALFGDTKFDLQGAYTPLATIGDLSSAVFMRVDAEIHDGRQFIANIKKGGRPSRWSHSGRQLVYHVAGEALIRSQGLTCRDVPFQGAPEARNALVNGEVEFAVIGTQHLVGFEKEIRMIGVLSDARDPMFPTIPTFKEQGITCPSVSSPSVLHVRTNTPQHILKELERLVEIAAKSPIFKSATATAGLPAIYKTAEETRRWIADAYAEWRPIVDDIRRMPAR